MNQNKNRSTQGFGALQKWSFEDYMKAEGMTSGSVSLPGTDISIKER